MKKKRMQRMEKYWICDECVRTKHPDWGSPGVCTATYGLCGHCKRKDVTTLIPMCDYPRKGHIVVWD